MGETETCRPHLAKFCIGNGLDIGFGGYEPIVPNAICMDRPPGDGHRPRNDGKWPTHIMWDAFQPLPFKDRSLDWIYSSHCLEDAVNTLGVLENWLRCIQTGGLLVLFLPDQTAYLNHCRGCGQDINQDHVHNNFSLEFVKIRAAAIGNCTVHHERFPLDYNPYSFELVLKKL